MVGIPDEAAGELPKAFIVSKSGILKEEVNSYQENQVDPHKKTRGGIEFVEKIPKSASGKILRRVLMDCERLK